MKKIKMAAVAIISITMIVTMISCTNDISDNPITPSGGDRYVHISMRILDDTEGSDAGVTRTEFNSDSKAVKFVRGDVVYVGNAGRYIGKLHYIDGLLSGDILNPSSDDYLHLYYLGNKDTGTLTPGETTSCSVDISDQKKNLPLLIYGKSHVKYSDDTSTYICIMESKIGIVEIDLIDATNDDIKLNGMHVKANIDFANPDSAITTAEEIGSVTLFAKGDKRRFAVLMPQKAVKSTIVESGAKEDTVSIPEIIANHALVNEKALKANPSYYFSVGNGRKVVISPGDLQYRNNNGGEWRFAEHPWDGAIGTPDDPSQWKDEFEFWGWDNGSTPRPYQSAQKYVFFRPTLNGYDSWRIMDTDEWNYLLGDSPERKDKWCVGVVHGKFCLIVFPDKYDGNTDFTPGSCPYNDEEVAGWNQYNIDWDSNIRHGAVLFPFGWEKTYHSSGPYSTSYSISLYNYWTYCYDKSYWGEHVQVAYYFKPTYFYAWAWGGFGMESIPAPGVYSSGWRERNHVRLVRDW